MRNLFIIFISGMLLFGCLNFGQPSDKIAPVKDISKDNTKGSNATIVITSTKNKTVGTDKTNQTAVIEQPINISYSEDTNAKMAAYFVYVGDEDHQGDAILIKKGDVDILVDAGPKENVGKLMTQLQSSGVDDIEILISTHADPDHYGGMKEVLDKYDVEQFWWNGQDDSDPNYKEILSEVNSKKIPVKKVSYGDKFEINGVTFSVLNPPEPEAAFTDSDNNAIALKVQDNKVCMMLTSDILFGAEIKLVQRPMDLQCDIMQMPTHGLGTGNAQIDQLLLKVQPKVAIMSGGPGDSTIGADKKGSRPATYEKLKVRGVTQIFENYKNGGKTVRVSTDGELYTVDYVK